MKLWLNKKISNYHNKDVLKYLKWLHEDSLIDSDFSKISTSYIKKDMSFWMNINHGTGF